jgi:uncharacterized membrane protein
MKNILISLSLAASFLCLGTLPTPLLAQEVHEDIQGIWKAKVLEVVEQEKRLILGTDTYHLFQTLRVEILEGERKGEVIVLENDFLELKRGDKFFLNFLITIDGEEIYTVRDIDRRGPLLFFLGLFILAVLLMGGKQGIRSLISLAGSFFVILYILVPSLLAGYPPILTSIVLASLILFIAIYFTHGFNRESTAAFAGTVIGVIFTGILAYAGVALTRLTGFASDEAVYLNFNIPGLDFAGILLGGIMIGVLGVLDDIAITQAAVVSELYGSSPNISRKEAYRRALRVGKEHVGALVNTLALAYTGASLPLLLLFSTSAASAGSILNQEVFATEIIRTIVGSVGLIMTVPITTLIAVFMLERYRGKPSSHSHHGHSHAHDHSH